MSQKRHIVVVMGASVLFASTAMCGLIAAGSAVDPKDARPFVVDGPSNPEVWEKTAIKEFDDYFSRLARSGKVTVDGKDGVVFHIGNTAFAESKGMSSSSFQDEEWAIRSFGRDVVLNGGGTRGCLYAVYNFLENFGGVHWWADNDEYVPVAKPLAFDAFDVHGKPHFIYRDIFRWGTSDPRTAIRNRLNRNGDVRIPLEYGGCLDYGPPYHCHTYDKYISFARFGKTHPEWFSLKDGKRVGGLRHGQLCLTNPELRAVFLRLLLEQIDKSQARSLEHGMAAPRIFAVEMNDNPVACECPKCAAEIRKYGHSGWQLNFVNALAAEVALRHPDVMLTMLAYFHSEPAPTNGVRAADNVIVKFANTRGNLAGPTDDAGNDFLRKFVSTWKDCAKTLFVWDYAITYKDQTDGFPFPSEFHFDDRCRLYATNNVRGVFLEHERWDTADMFELKYYVECKILEDPSRDARKLVREFCDLFYGPAGDRVFAARQRIESARAERNAVVTWEPTVTEFNYISKDVLAAAIADFDAAEDLVRDDAKLLQHVKRARGGLDRLAKCRREAGEICPPEEGVSEAPFFDFPADKKTYEPWKSSGAAFVEDAEAFRGRAVKMPVTGMYKDRSFDHRKHYSLPFNFGVYDTINKKTVKAACYPKPKGEGYNWYSLGEFKFPNTGFYVYVTRKWTLKILAGHPEISEHTYDLRLHVKFTGPLYNVGDTRENAIWVDRMIFVKRPDRD